MDCPARGWRDLSQQLLRRLLHVLDTTGRNLYAGTQDAPDAFAGREGHVCV